VGLAIPAGREVICTGDFSRPLLPLLREEAFLVAKQNMFQ
jgi:hypothetical protein